MGKKLSKLLYTISPLKNLVFYFIKFLKNINFLIKNSLYFWNFLFLKKIQPQVSSVFSTVQLIISNKPNLMENVISRQFAIYWNNFRPKASHCISYARLHMSIKNRYVRKKKSVEDRRRYSNIKIHHQPKSSQCFQSLAGQSHH